MQVTQDACTPEGAADGAPRRSADLTATAYERIEELFVSMRLRPGASIRTQDIQALVHLGRTPVHQAVRRLAAETLLEIVPRNGLRIAPIDLARERHLAVLRRDLIRFVTEAAMRNMTADDRSRMIPLRRRLADQSRPLTIDRFNEIDKAFDILMIEASGERFLERALRPLHAIARRTGYLHLTLVGGAAALAETVDRHLAIVDAVLAGDGEAVRTCCDDLIGYSVDLIDDLKAQIDPTLLDVGRVPAAAMPATGAAGHP